MYSIFELNAQYINDARPIKVNNGRWCGLGSKESPHTIFIPLFNKG